MSEKYKSFIPPIEKKEAEHLAQNILGKMDLTEKLDMIGGTRGFYIQGNKRLDVPDLFMSDASHGVRIIDSWLDEKLDFYLERSTSFPCLIQLASTWNTELAGKYAKSIGEECRAGGIAILLGPGMNIYRQAQSGRNFEYLGEDPYLASRFIENYVVNLQNTGVIATLKHFIANDTDFFRKKSNSIVDERTLHEIYLPPFKAGIDAGAMAVMTSYNLLNGEWCSQNKDVINGLLRNSLGFDWLVMTDWYAVYDAEKTIKSGQDLEMPASNVLQKTEELLNKGKITESDIDRMVLNILKTCFTMNLYEKDFKKPEYLGKYNEHEAIALQTAEEGIVLLKNSNNLLPLEKGNKILLTGKFISETAFGGGAAEVRGYNHRSLLETLTDEFGTEIEYLDKPSDKQVQQADVVILSTGTMDGEAYDRPFSLPESEDLYIRHITDINKNTIIIINSGSGIRMTDWHNSAAAIIYGWYGGQTGNRAMTNIISGKVNPSGKLPITIEREFRDSPGYGYIPEGEELYTGWNDEEEEKHPVYDINYNEGIFVGYRWYEKKKIDPLFPFGFGLSYTNFSYSKPDFPKTEINANEKLHFSFDVTNTGSVIGAETAQIYVQDIKSSEIRPIKELKGFSKVFLNVGETKTINMVMDRDAFSFWNEMRKDWYLEPGIFKILVGSSSVDIILSQEITIV